MGPKYNLPYDKKELPIKNVISEVEDLIKNIPDDPLDEKDEMRRQITRSITSFKLRENIHKTPQDLFSMKYFKETKTFLNDHPEITIVRADKGNVSIAIKKDDYDVKVQELVSDSEFYEEKTKIPIWSLENKANKIVTKMFEKSVIDEETRNCLFVSNTIEPKLYAVIKHHKFGFPGRPIVTCNQSASEKLSK